ncbi:MAG: hypothetical protein R3C05_15375 [Pirellulaceae bacterium]
MKPLKYFRNWDSEQQIGEPQDSRLVSKAPRLSKADGMIDWTLLRRQVDRHRPPMQPWPDAFDD